MIYGVLMSTHASVLLPLACEEPEYPLRDLGFLEVAQYLAHVHDTYLQGERGRLFLLADQLKSIHGQKIRAKIVDDHGACEHICRVAQH